MALHDMCDGGFDAAIVPQVARASVVRPNTGIRRKALRLTQMPRGIGFQLGQGTLGSNLSAGNDDMNVIAAGVDGEQSPRPLLAVGLNGLDDALSTCFIQFDRRMTKLRRFGAGANGIRFHKRRPGDVVFVIHRPALIAVQPCSLARPGQQISERLRHVDSVIPSRVKVKPSPERERGVMEEDWVAEAGEVV